MNKLSIITDLSPSLQFTIIFTIMSFMAFINESLNHWLSIVSKTILIGIISYLLTLYIRKYRNKVFIITKGKAVLITGCDTGFGNKIALKLNRNGFRVYATVLSVSSNGAKQLSTNCAFNNKMHILDMDVTNDANVLNTYKHIKKDLQTHGDQLWAVINNAGLFSCGHLEWGTLDTFHKVFAVNVFGMIRVTRTFLPLIKVSKGRVINMVSLAGRFTFDLGGIYCMTKHACIAFCDTLRREMHKFGVKVITIEPGLFRTPMTNEKYISDLLINTWNQSSDTVKKSYGESYLNLQKEVALDFHNRFKAGSDIGLVVDDTVDAVLNSEPQIMYRPIEGIQSKVLTLLPAYIPSKWLDLIVFAKDKSKPENIYD
ncbi:retinol dehydrogenase 16-like [Oppia nitens]|uniref:retinol dehydrogenase 16-like n=1 Tax=Oppia nitens TaxID=1686743 RepID=UPI0023DB980D|nr:retinol dehydrogenase 16-like [Oppia nitens]